MWRTLAFVLLLANVVFGVWAQGWLEPLGLAPDDPSEPQRLQQQVRPEEMKVAPLRDTASTAVLPPAAVASATNTAVACWRAGPFTPAQTTALRRDLQGLSADAWQLEGVAAESRWRVTMGPYEAEELAIKRRQLEARGLTQYRVLGRSISLGEYTTEVAATRALEKLSQRAVRSARVMELKGVIIDNYLRLPQANPALKLQAERSSALLRDTPFVACP